MMIGANKYAVYWNHRYGAGRKLTTRKMTYRRTPNFKSDEQRLLAQRARGLWAWHNRSQRLLRIGLTTRGTPRKYRRLADLAEDVRERLIAREARERMARLRASRKRQTPWQKFRAEIGKVVVPLNVEDVTFGEWRRWNDN